MTKKQAARIASLLPNGKPKKVRCYDNGGRTADRFTVVFSGHWRGKTIGWTSLLHMSSAPYHPQGVGIHDQVQGTPDHPRYSHLGKKISFDALPADCQKAVLEDYKVLWDLT